MAKKANNRAAGKTSLTHPQIPQAITVAIDQMYPEHEGELIDVMEKSETKKITLNFKVDLDFSETEPTVCTTMRFSSCVTDKRIARLDDPTQPLLLRTADEDAKLFGKKAAADPDPDSGE